MNQKDKDERAKASKEFYEEFAENTQQLFDYDSACHDFISYLEKYGTGGDPDGSVVEVATILEKLCTHFESLEDYEECMKIKRLTDSMVIPSARFSNPSFLYKVETILGFDNNCEVCWQLLDSHRMFLFDIYRKVIATEIDGLTYCVILGNYFYDKGQHDRCVLIKAHIDELFRENLEEGGKPFGAVDGLWS